MSGEVHFKPIVRHRVDASLHLHALWHRGPEVLRGLQSAISLCGRKKLPREKVTTFLEDVTCNECKQRAARVNGGNDE